MYNDNGGLEDPGYNAAYRQAEKRVRAKLDFYTHLAVYVLVNGFLIIIYLTTGPIPGWYNYPWFVWSMFGWGIGLLFHYLAVFMTSHPNHEDTRRRMIEAEMRRMGTYPVQPDPNAGPTSSPYNKSSDPSSQNRFPPDQL